MVQRERIIQADRSVIVAADVEAAMLPKLVENTCLVQGVGGYKLGFELGLEQGLSSVVAMVRDRTQLPVIYDHQKAGTDIPATGRAFARVCSKAGINAAILFPFGGGETEPAWIRACQDAGLGVIVGAHMTQPKFLWNEGGFIDQHAPDRIFDIAMGEGVRDFVVPGNKIEAVGYYRRKFDTALGLGNFTLYAPGFITQGGDISDVAGVAGNRWHAIVGSAIYQAVDMRAAAEKMTQQLR